jgi:hypothetical protein
VSATEIIQELPKLTEAERREVRRKLAELSAVADEDVALCHETALATFQELDKREADDDRQTRPARLKKFFSTWDTSHSVTVGEKPTRQRTYADNSRLR